MSSDYGKYQTLTSDLHKCTGTHTHIHTHTWKLYILLFNKKTYQVYWKEICFLVYNKLIPMGYF